MKTKIKKEIEVEISICNICGKEVKKEPFNKLRIAVVRGLFKMQEFDAHEICINKVVRAAFQEYIK